MIAEDVKLMLEKVESLILDILEGCQGSGIVFEESPLMVDLSIVGAQVTSVLDRYGFRAKEEWDDSPTGKRLALYQEKTTKRKADGLEEA